MAYPSLLRIDALSGVPDRPECYGVCDFLVRSDVVLYLGKRSNEGEGTYSIVVGCYRLIRNLVRRMVMVCPRGMEVYRRLVRRSCPPLVLEAHHLVARVNHEGMLVVPRLALSKVFPTPKGPVSVLQTCEQRFVQPC